MFWFTSYSIKTLLLPADSWTVDGSSGQEDAKRQERCLKGSCKSCRQEVQPGVSCQSRMDQALLRRFVAFNRLKVTIKWSATLLSARMMTPDGVRAWGASLWVVCFENGSKTSECDANLTVTQTNFPLSFYPKLRNHTKAQRESSTPWLETCLIHWLWIRSRSSSTSSAGNFLCVSWQNCMGMLVR